MRKRSRHISLMKKKTGMHSILVVALVVTLGLFSNTVVAQVKKTASVKKSKLFSVGHSTKKEILIRWAPADEAMWRDANKYGYAVERYTVVKDGKVLEKFERMKSRLVFKPRPVAEWDSLMQKDDYAAVLAQAIYGDDFDVEMTTEKDGVAKIINETEKLKQRYNMSMYAADHSFTAAVQAGLGWKDINVKPNDKYFYRIYSLIPKEVRKTDTSLLYVGLSDYKALPKPSDIITEFGDKSALLKWDFDSYREHYTSYIIERSDDDGKTFKPVSDKPVTSLNDKSEGSPTASMLYIDTLADNITQYQYRIAGVSLFGDTGPYSGIVKGRGKALLPLTPNIVNVTSDNETYRLNWAFEDSLNGLIKEFRINHAERIEGPYNIVSQNIKPGERSIVIDSLAASNYYTVTAVSIEGEERSSLPYLLQPEDSIPPAVPVGLHATVDSSGIVQLSWDANNEKDLEGYRILKTNVKGHEWVPLFDSVWHTNSVKDTVNLKSLNSKIYYTIRAVDNRYNQSDVARMIEVKIPDIIPPTQPVLIDYDITDKGIKISWINSADEDVAFHQVYRKRLQGAGEWERLYTVNDTTTHEFFDTGCEEGKTYSYTVIAVDSSKLESAPAIPLTVSVPERRIREAISKLTLEVDRQNRMIAINWEVKKDSKNIKQFEIYRGWDKQSMSLYQQLEADKQSFTDKELRVNTKYKYAVRAVYSNGAYSDFVVKNVIY